MTMKQNIALAAFLLMPAGLAAQTQAADTALNRTVVVEQEYAPRIQDAAKVNVLPRVEEPDVTPREVEYDAATAPLAQMPTDTLQTFAANEPLRQATRGYARAGYGNYNNLDIRADYRFRLSARDRLGLTFALDGMDGRLNPGDGAEKWNTFRYHTRAALDYTHRFRRIDLDAAARFGLRHFGLLPGSAASKQKFTSGDVHIGAASTTSEWPVQFRAETNLLLYQRLYSPGFHNAQEVGVRTRADVWGAVGHNQAVGIDLQMDNRLYRRNSFDNYTALSLTPYYAYKADGWTLRVGMHIDPSMGFGKKFRMSPDLLAQYTFPARTTLYVQARGGRLLNDFRRLEALSPYTEPAAQLDATYEQVNAALGIRVGTLSGLGLHLYGGYQDLKDDLCLLSPTSSAAPFPAWMVWDTHNIYAGLGLSYSYRDLVTLTGEGIYRHWSASDKGEQAGALALKPAFEGNVKLEVRPLSPLHAYVGYRHIARTSVGGQAIDPVSNLYLGAFYDLVSGLGAYAKIDNLLNKHYWHTWLCPTEGLNFVVGLTFCF